MKKVRTWITNIIFIIIISPLLVLAAVYLVLLIPFDYIRYKRSIYYKNEKKKYSLLEGTNENFKFYNEIIQFDLPIKYIKHPRDDSVASGWFAYGETLFIMNFLEFEYDEQREMWTSWQEDDDGKYTDLMTLDELIEMELQHKNELLGGTPYENAVVWIGEKSLSNIERARKDERFLIYEKDREEVLRCFCERR